MDDPLFASLADIPEENLSTNMAGLQSFLTKPSKALNLGNPSDEPYPLGQSSISPRQLEKIFGPSASQSVVSPSKELEMSMDLSSPWACVKKKSVDRAHLKLELTKANNNTRKVTNLKVINTLFTQMSETFTDGIEIEPMQIFSTCPNSPSLEFKAMLDAIDVSPDADCSEEDFLKRQLKPSIRRCRSLEMRKHLNDLSNTPTNAFKRNVFKRPPEADSIQLKCVKRTRDVVLSENCITNNDTDMMIVNEEKGQDKNLYHERIKTAVDALESPDLIADGSREYCLPVITGKHSDLKNISHQTMADLLSHVYESSFDKLTIIDCRYPYEYEGGHIKGAINIYTEDKMIDFLNKEIKEVTRSAHRHILVFHCEFSSQRGPSLLRHLRKYDRQLNVLHYPQLTFPEVYCLFGGYKDFFINHPHLCEPSNYVPMVDEKYSSDLRHFRIKAKSWAAGEKKLPIT
ncbi:unnamed protein product [Lymnaea stagnalis]|uniref:M-phase inducer phosphatase n=1 Tax=Lymnaea stagnalis TaxID=6523 RepID=A0AAV2IRC2_LYMST